MGKVSLTDINNYVTVEVLTCLLNKITVYVLKFTTLNPLSHIIFSIKLFRMYFFVLCLCVSKPALFKHSVSLGR